MFSNIIKISLFCSSSVAAVVSIRADEAVSITAPAAAPSGAPLIAANFAGFAFEERSFYHYFGTPDNPNSFSLSMLEAITSRTKTKANIRVGGSSLDASQYDPNQTIPIKGEEEQGISSNMTFGPSYFDAFQTLPNAEYVIDVPFKKGNLQNSLLFVKDAYQKIGAANIVALEIGNEPNNYGKTIPKYVSQWINWSAQILDTLGLDANQKYFQAIGLSPEVGPNHLPGGNPDAWKVSDLFEADQGLTTIQSRIKSVSMHYYQAKANPKSDLHTDIMNHTAVVGGSVFVKDAVDYLNKFDPPIPLALAETASALGNGSNNDPLEAVLGSALWQVDFFLYSMSIGVQRINWQSGLYFSFALWNPVYQSNGVTVPASVHAAFYGQIFAAEFRGDSDNVQVFNQALGRPFVSAYMAYDNGVLARVAIVNLNLWSQAEQSERSGKEITLVVGTAAKSVEIKRLTAVNGGTALVSNITWGGEQWTAESAGQGVRVLDDTTSVPVSDGKVRFSVPASEAVLLFVKY